MDEIRSGRYVRQSNHRPYSAHDLDYSEQVIEGGLVLHQPVKGSFSKPRKLVVGLSPQGDSVDDLKGMHLLEECHETRRDYILNFPV